MQGKPKTTMKNWLYKKSKPPPNKKLLVIYIDAVMLANAIYELGASDQAVATPAASPYEPTTTKGLTYSPPTSERITAAFEEYRAHRFPEAKHLYEYSQFVSRLVHGQVIKEFCVIFFLFCLSFWSSFLCSIDPIPFPPFTSSILRHGLNV